MPRTVRRLFALNASGEAATDIAMGIEGENVIHIEGVPLLGSQTLCGHVDRTTIDWSNTDDAPTCAACLAVWRFVKNGKL